MAVGLRIRNSGNILQIDGTYRNSELIVKGTLSLDSTGSGLITLPPSKSMTLIAFRDATNGVYWQMENATTIKVFTGLSSNPSPPTITYYIFGEPDIPISGGIGLVIRNPSNALTVYNSRKKYLKILQTISQQIPVDTSVSASFPGKTVAICQNMRPYRWKIDTGGTPQQPIFVLSVHGGCMSTPNDSTATITNRQIRTATGFGPNVAQIVNALDANYFFIDVTGY